MNQQLYDTDKEYRKLVDKYNEVLKITTEMSRLETCPKCYYYDEKNGIEKAYRCHVKGSCPYYERVQSR